VSVSDATGSRRRARRAEHVLYFALVAVGTGLILWFVFAILSLLRAVLGGGPWRDS